MKITEEFDKNERMGAHGDDNTVAIFEVQADTASLPNNFTR